MPGVTLATPTDPRRASAFLNMRVADIASVCRERPAKGAEFLTEPKDHGARSAPVSATPTGT